MICWTPAKPLGAVRGSACVIAAEASEVFLSATMRKVREMAG
ncbi:MAG: hypothetical protein ACRD82_04635 [Blastocatellia bacterium]